MSSRFLSGRALAFSLPINALVTNLGGFLAQNVIANVGASYGPNKALACIAGAAGAYALLTAWLDHLTVAEVRISTSPREQTSLDTALSISERSEQQ